MTQSQKTNPIKKSDIVEFAEQTSNAAINPKIATIDEKLGKLLVKVHEGTLAKKHRDAIAEFPKGVMQTVTRMDVMYTNGKEPYPAKSSYSNHSFIPRSFTVSLPRTVPKTNLTDATFSPTKVIDGQYGHLESVSKAVQGYAKKIQDLVDTRSKLVDERDDIKEKILTTLGGVRTIKALRKVWPACENSFKLLTDWEEFQTIYPVAIVDRSYLNNILKDVNKVVMSRAKETA